MSDRPNILYVFTDQQSADAMSCAGNGELFTPNFDRFAAESLRFTRAYCAQPVCMPSRAAMQTGRWPHANGVIINPPYKVSTDQVLMARAAGRPQLGRILRDAGYDTAYMGRWHLKLPPDDPDLHGYDFLAIHDNEDDALPDEMERFLSAGRRGPFFAVVGICNPHDICHWAKDGPFRSGAIPPAPPPEECPPLPASFGLPENQPDCLRAFLETNTERYRVPGFDPGRWRQFRWAYHRFVERADAVFGRLMALLEQRGRREQTVVVFSSDHGEGAGCHGWCHKQALYDESARVPLLVSSPDRSRAGQSEAALASAGVDLYPTFCDYAGIEPPVWLHGRSLRPWVDGNPPCDWRQAVVSESEFCTTQQPLGYRARMLRTQRYKYIAYSEGDHREQLFDMDEDPRETVDLADSPHARPALRALREQLRTWCEETDDFFRPPAI